MTTTIPNPRESLVDENGRINASWYRFLAQFVRDGQLSIALNSIGDDDLREGAACSIIGRSANSTGNVGDIAASANGLFLQRDGNQVVFRLPKLPSYTVAGLPSAATSGAGSIVYVSNESGGAVVAFSDATNWRRVTDRAIVS